MSEDNLSSKITLTLYNYTGNLHCKSYNVKYKLENKITQ